MRRAAIRITLVVAAIASVVGLVTFDYFNGLPADSQAQYVGRTSCVQCHAKEAAAYAHSHHDLAMDLATEETVLGDFNDAQFEHHGIESRMFKDGSRYMIHTEGPDGAMQDFEIKYVFGVDPLQQYMIEFDRTESTPVDAVARVQVLRICWDTHRKKWFYLPPPDVAERLAPDDDLHWTGIAQRWNTMCAECHSTDLKRNYDAQQGTYATTFSEIDVSCEACHGPGSLHVEMASKKSLFWDRRLGYGLANLKSTDSQVQIDTCAPCHSRRGVLSEGFSAGNAYCDHFDPSLIRETLYHADGQILDEVYVYGSFLQSKMYHKGIRCTDCHDPHSLNLKANGNQVCTSCHQHPAGKYDTPSHHKHEPGKAGSQCVDCHMPSTTYMMVDPRRDHSLRVPRPDLSVALGTPNACTGCHLDSANVSDDKRAELIEYADWQRAAAAGDTEIQNEMARANQWCVDAMDKWYGNEWRTKEHYASAFHAAWDGRSEASDRLTLIAKDVANTPAIIRATALELLSRQTDLQGLRDSVSVGRDALEDPSPMVRAAAIAAFSGEVMREQGMERFAKKLAPMLVDPSFLVRSQAVRALASTGAFRMLSPPSAKYFDSNLSEIKEGMKAIGDRAGAHMDWAQICEQIGRVNEAVQSYQTAIKVEPNVTGPRSNLAGLLEQVLESQASSGQLAEAQAGALRESITRLRKEELPLLERDANLAADNAVIHYRLGLAYYLDGQMDKARESLIRANQLEQNEDFALALRLLEERLQELQELRGAPPTDAGESSSGN